MLGFDTKAQLPVLYQLATEFAICDHWFLSLPGPTWPNRFFVHGASSAGLDHSPTQTQMVGWEAPRLGLPTRTAASSTRCRRPGSLGGSTTTTRMPITVEDALRAISMPLAVTEWRRLPAKVRHALPSAEDLPEIATGTVREIESSTPADVIPRCTAADLGVATGSVDGSATPQASSRENALRR